MAVAIECNMNWHEQQAVVIGGSGFLGKYIVEQLLALDCGSITSFSRHGDTDLANQGVNIVKGDLRDPAAVIHACAGASVVFHTAAKAGIWGDYQDFFEINVAGTANVLAACRQHNIRNLVYTSSPSVAYPPTMNIENADETLPYPDDFLADYPETKAVAERLVMTCDFMPLSVAALRPHLIWGPRDPHLLPRIIKAAQSGRLTIVGDGNNKVDLTYVANAAAAHIRAAEYLANKNGLRKKFFISDGAPVNLWDWNNNLLSRLGIPPVTRKISYRKAYLAGAIMEFIYRAFPTRKEPPMTRFVAGQLAFSHYFNINAARHDLNYQPVISPENALNQTMDWLQKEIIHQ